MINIGPISMRQANNRMKTQIFWKWNKFSGWCKNCLIVECLSYAFYVCACWNDKKTQILDKILHTCVADEVVVSFVRICSIWELHEVWPLFWCAWGHRTWTKGAKTKMTVDGRQRPAESIPQTSSLLHFMIGSRITYWVSNMLRVFKTSYISSKCPNAQQWDE